MPAFSIAAAYARQTATSSSLFTTRSASSSYRSSANFISLDRGRRRLHGAGRAGHLEQLVDRRVGIARRAELLLHLLERHRRAHARGLRVGELLRVCLGERLQVSEALLERV